MSVHWGGRGAGHVSRLSTATTGVPSLALNFLTGTLDSSITFTRASTATFIGSNGLIQSAAINEPRFDYDPVTLAPKGLLMEEQRTNLFLNSLIDGTSLSTQTVTVTAVAHTISFYGTGTITLAGAAVAIVTGTGIYPSRKTLTFTPTAGALICTVTGSVQYAQIEVGGFATSFIPTAGTSVVRNADSASMTGTNFSSWYNQSEGTFVAAFDTVDVSTYAAVAVAFTDLSNRIDLGTGNFILRSSVANGGVTQADLQSAGTTVANAVNTIAFAYKVNSFASAINGGGLLTDTSGTVPSISRLDIGHRNNDGFTQLSGHIRRIAYYNTRLLNTQLQALTT